ncbi:MAG TPA: alginate lyase family protein, partial [Anaeromyxobacteraceae bacterium]|nr:alginate lyase family protein [Anaeromyxobacteraceae bacterium]
GTRCPGPGALAERLASQGRGLAARDRAGLATALRRFFPGEAARAVDRAERAAAGRLVLFGHLVDAARPGGGTDWQLDAIHGGRFAAWAPSDALPEVPGADIKVAWALGRGEQWVAMACGAIATDDPAQARRLSESYVASLRDFVAQNPAGQGAHWASPMEAALRMVCAGQAHALLAGAPALADGGYAVDLARLAVATGRFVLTRLEDGQVVPNNHLAADWLGLLACAALLPEWPEAARWRELAVAGLVRELLAQTHEEGTSFEGSIPYHRLAVEIFTAGALLARLVRIPLGGAAWRRLGRLYASTRALVGAGGALPQIGDDDSGRVLAFRERDALEGGYLLPLAAAVTGDPALRVRPGALDAEEVLWLCGPAAVERLFRARAGAPPGSASFPAGGFHLLRRGGVEVAISCGRNGQAGVGGHSHNDKLAFELRVGGRLAVCDPGSPSYLRDPELRDRFRATRAHATVCIDGAEQAPIPPARPFALPDAADARCTAFESSRRRERLVGEHRGYARFGVLHRREFLLLDGVLVVADRISGLGRHAVELRFPFPSREARLRPVTAAERQRLERLGDGTAALFALSEAFEVGPADAPLCALVAATPVPLQARLEEASYSPGYAQLVPSRTGVWSGRIACPATLVTVVLPLAGARAGPVHKE